MQLHCLLPSAVIDEKCEVKVILLPPTRHSLLFLLKKIICFFLFPQGDQGFVPSILKFHHNVTTKHVASFLSPILVFGAVLFRGLVHFINSGHFSSFEIFDPIYPLCPPSETCSGGCGKHVTVSSTFPTFLSRFSSRFREFLSSVFLLFGQSL